jgi:CHAT domain-containing protein
VPIAEEDLPSAPGQALPPTPSPTGLALRQALFDPLLPALSGRTRLLLAPDGDLCRLPFEVLPSDAGGLLIDDYQISYLTCGRDALRFGTAPSDAGEPLVIGDPAFDLTGEGVAVRSEPRGASTRQSRDLGRGQIHFPPLDGTRGECKEIAAMLGVRPWLQADALEAPLKQQRSPAILHLATHGFFLEDQPHDPHRGFRDMTLAGPGSGGRLSGPLPENPLLRSGLALAGANTWLRHGPLPADAEDGLLTAEDVTGLDLLGTRLAVLSACETGLGQIHVGEGVFGLRRAFVLAGTQTLVMSLWKVPDGPTRELMADFYARLRWGQGRADALRAAQLALKARHPDPYYWGAFICQGDPEPLDDRLLSSLPGPARQP